MIEFWILKFLSNRIYYSFQKLTFFISDYYFENKIIWHIYRLYFVILHIYILFRIINRFWNSWPKSYRKKRILNRLIDRKIYIGKFLIEFESGFDIEKNIRLGFLDSIQDP